MEHGGDDETGMLGSVLYGRFQKKQKVCGYYHKQPGRREYFDKSYFVGQYEY